MPNKRTNGWPADPKARRAEALRRRKVGENRKRSAEPKLPFAGDQVEPNFYRPTELAKPLLTRAQQIKAALRDLDFGWTIFFSDESGKKVKMYQGTVVEEQDK